MSERIEEDGIGESMTPERLTDLLLSEWRAAGAMSLLFDYDGTLADITSEPHLATLDTATRHALEALSTHPYVRVAVVTGRGGESFEEVAGKLRGPELATNGGMRVTGPDGEWVHPEAAALVPRLSHLAAQLRKDTSSHPGAWVEDKHLSLAVHFRNAPEARDALRQAVHRRLDAEGGTFRLVPGKAVLEIQPAIEWDKGRAAEVLLERWGAGHAFFAGDDVIDEPAFAAVRRRGGTACLVGGSGESGALPTHATVQLENPAACRRLVIQLARALG